MDTELKVGTYVEVNNPANILHTRQGTVRSIKRNWVEVTFTPGKMHTHVLPNELLICAEGEFHVGELVSRVRTDEFGINYTRTGWVEAVRRGPDLVATRYLVRIQGGPFEEWPANDVFAFRKR